MSTGKSPSPRIFISYSWTSEDHVEWVADLGERLMNDGIDVVLDQWSLKDGQDLNTFMEQMVTDPTIKRVIIVSDAQYATKADARKGGVGTESQIISQEVYEKVDQEKFVPLICERNEDGLPCLPVFLKSRKYIDFSNTDNEAEAYETLIRNIFERPVRRKPALGKPPSHLFEDNAMVVSCARKAKRFCDVVTSGKGNPSAAFDDFADEFITNLEDLRLKYSQDQKETWCQTMFDNIELSRAHRNAYVDVIVTGGKHLREEWFIASLASFLERLLPYQERPVRFGSHFQHSEDNYKFILYELFLYTIASLIKARSYTSVLSLFEHRYVTREYLDDETLAKFTFNQFNNHPPSLEGDCADRGETRRLSVMADLLHDRADRNDIRFSDLLQADVVCCLADSRVKQYCSWYPRSLVYAGRIGLLELFARATNETGFKPLAIMIGYSSPREMLTHICSEQMSQIWNGRDLFRSFDAHTTFNFDELSRVWSMNQSG